MNFDPEQYLIEDEVDGYELECDVEGCPECNIEDIPEWEDF